MLKDIVTTSTGERCAWDFGLVIARVMGTPTPTQVGNQYPESSLKKFLKLRLRSQDKTFFPV